MGIFIKNPETERKVRELANRRGSTLTAAIDQALDQALKTEVSAPRAKKTLEEIRAATDRFRRATGLDKLPSTPVSKAEWDALWPTGIPEIDNL
ncbi:type II toxin-antitoxin system VapB family antitoxin [Caulobacter sp. DWR1-3-2b1]|uniref:type II toxin-antitoxin system VapB family antitoxin n=1 Tax=Caulobacter sp. DWR1-3-2b1 TaxID=2804670 RepID=UPI003CF0795E